MDPTSQIRGTRDGANPGLRTLDFQVAENYDPSLGSLPVSPQSGI